MKVLHLVAGDLTGGAARGAYWLHNGLRELGVQSKILTNSRTTLGDLSVVSIATDSRSRLFSIVRSRLDRLPLKLYRRRRPEIFSTGFCGFNFTKAPEYKEADILHLHWINAGLVNIKHLSKVDKPIIWTMRDMWPMTGGCHYAMDCENYLSGCGVCPHLNSQSRWDLSRFVLNRKKKYLSGRLVPVGISTWLSERAAESDLFKASPVRTIYNAIDTEVFSPLKKELAREILGIPLNKTVILVAAQYLRAIWKGFDKYLQAIELLDKNKYFLCFMGRCEDAIVEELGFDYKKFGFLYDVVSMRLLYSAADVFVAPSIIEAFGKTLIEAMACGTPVVCFDATGPKDIVDHKVNGYKAEPFSINDLADGIRWVSQHSNPALLQEAARKKVIEKFDTTVVAKQYIELYEQLLVR